MASVQPVFGYPGLRISFTCAEPILGGQLVERRAGTDLVGVAAAASLKVAGVALDDVPAVRSFVNGPQVGDGHELTVYARGVVLVTFLLAATEGQTLQCAAGGQVTPWVPGGDPSMIIGRALDAVAATAKGRAYIAPLGI